jgi:hypothetical protein
LTYLIDYIETRKNIQIIVLLSSREYCASFLLTYLEEKWKREEKGNANLHSFYGHILYMIFEACRGIIMYELAVRGYNKLNLIM